MKIRFVLAILFATSTFPFIASALSVHLQVEGTSGTIYNNTTLSVEPCAITDDAEMTNTSIKCALEAANLSPDWTNFGGDDWYLVSANGVGQDASHFWQSWSDLSYGSEAFNKHVLQENEHVLVTLVPPLKVEVSTLTPSVGSTLNVTVSQFFDASFTADWFPSEGATITVGGTTYTSDASGVVQIPISSDESFDIFAEKNEYVDSATLSIDPPDVTTATIVIFNGTSVATSSIVLIPDAGTPDVTIATPDGSHTAPATSAVSLVTAFDAIADEFTLSELQYFNGLGLFVQCITFPIDDERCGEWPSTWHFAVNGSDALVGMSSYLVQDGDIVSLYFFDNSARRASLNVSSITANSSFDATVEEYNPETGLHEASDGFTVGVISIPNPAEPWIYTEIATSTTDASGKATFTLSVPGTYAVGIQEDLYGITSSITVIEANQSGSGGGGGGTQHFQLSIPSALAYLISKQNGDGSFDSSLITDRAAIALSSTDSGTAKTKLHDHLVSTAPSMVSVTDYERHAMALMALGINPYSGTGVNYIAPIVNAFDGTQIGASIVHDDIFALFPLLHAGYSVNDTIIQKTVAYIISKQSPSGSWGDADTTAAAIQALGPLFSIPGVNETLDKAIEYLKSTQQANGSWGGSGVTNVDSTSWVQTAINAIPIDPAHQISWASASGLYPADALANAQQLDGAVRPIADSADNRVWSTSYALTAASGKSWNTILQSFPSPTSTSGGGGTVLGASTSTAATSTTPAIATSTPAVATSTPATIATTTPFVTTLEANTTASTTPTLPKAKKPVKKIMPLQIPNPVPATSSSSAQTATAGNASGGFMGSFWHALTSFFSSLF